MTKIQLPPLAEGVTKAAISYMYVKAGDQVKEGDSLVELVTDKATFNMPSPAAGKVAAILLKEGDEVNVGDTIMELE
jgi:pyruvate/2-oxoglutarate dehydrogenase complex dihydrolipoamide acyltransferase (E2) component